jgi:hypothetical protein
MNLAKLTFLTTSKSAENRAFTLPKRYFMAVPPLTMLANPSASTSIGSI